MAITSHINDAQRLTIFTVSGELVFDDLVLALHGFYQGAPTANVIWDLRKTEGNQLSAKELRKAAAFLKQHAGKRPQGKTALVAVSNLDFGLARVIMTYAEIENLPWHFRTFRSMSEAIGWLGADG